MRSKRIRATRAWHGLPRNDCIFAEKDPNEAGFHGLHAAQALLFFSFYYGSKIYPCALVRWFIPTADHPCPDTGMWTVEPDTDEDGEPIISVIHLDCVVRGAHLIGVYGDTFLPRGFSFTDSLYAFDSYYINKYIDHHAHEIAF